MTPRRSDGEAVRDLYWHCETCGMHSYAEEPYEHGDSEPCVHCRNGTARVMTTAEAAELEQRIALSERTPS